jgi:hypothetical protein
MSGTRPPLELVTANNRGGILVVYVTVVSCVSVSAIIVRLFVSLRRRLDFRSDDIFVLAALVRLPLPTNCSRMDC